jgi:DNA-binding LytR/AlgR family response regulator
MMIIPLQNWLFRKSGLWTIVHEIGFFLVYNVLILIGCFFYYRSSFLNGAYDFERFSLEIYYPTFIILFIILILSRWFLFNQQAKSESTKIMLRGDNKLDILQISLSDLVSISSADNYVEISYLKEKELKKKLLRNTLKDLQQQVPSLIKIHRSHLINPDHFIAWKDSTTILLTQTELPATKSYKASLDFLNSIPKNL